MAEIDERIVALQSRMFAARLKVSPVLERAHVSRSTWGRMVAGQHYYTGTLAKISDAIDAMIAERTPKGD